MYEFGMVHRDSNPTERKEVNYAIVEKKNNMLVAETKGEHGLENIKINDMLHTFLLTDDDIQHHKLKEGDIVDIAYYPNRVENAKVCWKHWVNESNYQKPQKSSVYKKNDSVDEEKEQSSELKGKHVLVIGCEPRKHVFREKIEQEGGVFSWAEGIEQEERLSSMIKKADVVLILISFIRHRASQLAVDVCKERNIPYSIIQSLGVDAVIEGAKN